MASQNQAPLDSTASCYRCGYDLRGIDAEQPCPECGLLARRSHRDTDELHNTPPRWLSQISRGANLILFGLLLMVVWPAVAAPRLGWMLSPSAGAWLLHLVPTVGWDVAALALLAGACLLASPEDYAPADRRDRWLRRLLRIAAGIPLLLCVLIHIQLDQWSRRFSGSSVSSDLGIAILLLATIGCAPLPLLIFLQLRSLAKRARSAHLAEHCMIVGIGTSSALLFALIAALIFENAEAWGFGHDWNSRSNVALWLMLLLLLSGILFTLWSFYLLVRFAVAFARAAKQRRASWKRDDRSMGPR